MPSRFPLDSGGAFVVFLMIPNTWLTRIYSVETRNSDPAAGMQLGGPSVLVQSVPFLACIREVLSSNLDRNTEYLD